LPVHPYVRMAGTLPRGVVLDSGVESPPLDEFARDCSTESYNVLALAVSGS
jgi:hypothetical protein